MKRKKPRWVVIYNKPTLYPTYIWHVSSIFFFSSLHTTCASCLSQSSLNFIWRLNTYLINLITIICNQTLSFFMFIVFIGTCPFPLLIGPFPFNWKLEWVIYALPFNSILLLLCDSSIEIFWFSWNSSYQLYIISLSNKDLSRAAENDRFASAVT